MFSSEAEGPSRKKICEKLNFFKQIKQIFFLVPSAFFSSFLLGTGNTLGFGMQLCFGVRIVGTEGFGCSFLEELGVILGLFTQLCKAAHLLNELGK